MSGRAGNILLATISLLATFLLFEVGARIYKGEFGFVNFLERRSNLFSAAYPSQYDPNLGWIPKPGSRGKDNHWNTEVTIGEHGIRSNGSTRRDGDKRPPILAVGDSFTFGDQVSDSETWPARLEERLGRPVLNAGVFGYGADQSYLRALDLVERIEPEILIFSFIPDDVGRCGLSGRSGVGKPFFAVTSGALELENVPAPPPIPSKIDPFRRLLGYSFLLHKTLMRTARSYWLEGAWQSKWAHDDGEQVVCLLFEALCGLARVSDLRVIVLVQYGINPPPEQLALVDRVLSCIDREMIEVVDLENWMAPMREADPEKYRRLYTWHMTEKGNEFVAGVLEEMIRSRP